ncbi:MAG: hypothetical protein K2W95_16985 [Candidatus Obscuribacterales bacterium]|nr:hypothetical protein [Candidatus Obscuribacterales bacterium]
MPQKPDFTLKFSLQNIEDFSPDAIARSPRSFRPGDLVNACNNVVLTAEGKIAPEHILSIAKFVTVDFFAMAHGSGLYNRQPKLWEALAKTATAQVFMARKGFLQKEQTAEFDLLLQDHKGRTTVVLHYSAPDPPGAQHDYLRAFKEFVKRTKLRQGTVGIFLCYPAPFPEPVRAYILKETNAQDPVQRYESILPLLGIPIDLFEVDSTAAVSRSDRAKNSVRLIHPDLSRKKSWSGARVRGANVEPEDCGDLEESDSEP